MKNIFKILLLLFVVCAFFLVGFYFSKKEDPIKLLCAHVKYFFWQEMTISDEDIYDHIDQKHVKDNIRFLINRSKKEKYSEIGGFVFWDHGEEDAYLRFKPVKSYNQKLCEEILAHRDSDEYLKRLFKREKEIFRIFHGHNKKLFNKICRYIDKNKQVKSKARYNGRNYMLNVVMDNFLAFSFGSYTITFEQFLEEVFYPGKPSNDFVSDFHIHPDGSPPSEADLQCSEEFRVFVVVDKKEGFSVFVLENTKIRKEFYFKYQ